MVGALGDPDNARMLKIIALVTCANAAYYLMEGPRPSESA